VAASALGTLATDASLYRRYRHDGGTAPFPAWESSEGLTLGKDLSAHLVFGTATAAAFQLLDR